MTLLPLLLLLISSGWDEDWTRLRSERHKVKWTCLSIAAAAANNIRWLIGVGILAWIISGRSLFMTWVGDIWFSGCYFRKCLTHRFPSQINRMMIHLTRSPTIERQFWWHCLIDGWGVCDGKWGNSRCEIEVNISSLVTHFRSFEGVSLAWNMQINVQIYWHHHFAADFMSEHTANNRRVLTNLHW